MGWALQERSRGAGGDLESSTFLHAKLSFGEEGSLRKHNLGLVEKLPGIQEKPLLRAGKKKPAHALKTLPFAATFRLRIRKGSPNVSLLLFKDGFMASKRHCGTAFFHHGYMVLLLWHWPAHARGCCNKKPSTWSYPREQNVRKSTHTSCCCRKKNTDIYLLPSRALWEPNFMIYVQRWYFLSSPLPGRMHLRSDWCGEQPHTRNILWESAAALLL